MKKTKKILIITFVVIMIVAILQNNSMATENDYSITISGDVSGKTFYLMKIFNITKEGDNYFYSWNESTQYAKDYFTSLGYDSPAKASEYVRTFRDNQYELIQFANNIFNIEKINDSKEVQNNENSVTFTGLSQGYYLIFDSDPLNDVPRSCAILKGLEQKNTIIDLKANKITIEKKISKETMQNGDEARITVNTIVPNTIGYNKDNYQYIITEKLTEGLEYKNKSLKIKVEGNEITTGFIMNYDSQTKELIITFDKFSEDLRGKKLEIIYDVTRLSVAGSLENKSTTTIEFSNDPKNQESTGKVTDINVYAYTYALSFIKQNTNGDTLSGAKFKIQMPDGKWAVFKDNVLVGKAPYETGATEIISGENGVFRVEGFKSDLGYILKETQAPNDYVLPTFKFKFDITQELDDNKKLVNCVCDYKSDEENPIAIGFLKDVISTNPEISQIKVLNVKGTLLPSTGGIGIEIFKKKGFTIIFISIFSFIIILKRKKENISRE